MRTAIVTLESTQPYSQSKYLGGFPREEKETAADHDKRVWRERCHWTGDGDDANLFIPGLAFKNCLSEAVKYLGIQIPGKGKANYTKHFEGGIFVPDNIVLPITRKTIKCEVLHVPSDGRRGGTKRVEKHFPIIHEWKGELTFIVMDDTITKEVFERVLREAGNFIGIGRFRPRNNGYYGRFNVAKIKWE